MKQLDNTYVNTYLILLFNFMFIEILFKVIGGSPIFNYSLLRIFTFTNIIVAILTYFLNLCSYILRKILIGLIVLVSSIYASLQLGFLDFLGVYMSFQTSSQFGAVTDYILDFFKSFKLVYYLELIPFILLLIYYIKFDKDSKKLDKTIALKSSIIIMLIFTIIFYTTITSSKFQNKLQQISNKDLFITASNPSYGIDQFGVNCFLFMDIRQFLFPVELDFDYEVATSYYEKEITDYSRLIDDTLWNKVIEEETNSTNKSLNNYFINRNIEPKNDYTGMFEGKNLIVIMMESVNDLFINEEYYPNFYELMTNGWYFSNSYSPRNSCATINNEFSGMTSLYSINNVCIGNNYQNNKYPNSIFNLFNNKNYVTFSLHDYTEAYYKRSILHKNMGSGEYFGVQKLNILWKDEYENWANDDEFMASFLNILDDKISNGENFFSWLTTVTTHQPYTQSSIAGDKFLDMTKGMNYSMDVRRYMSKLKVLDNALGVLIEGLKERDILDDTVILLYSDHYPYSISTQTLNKYLDYNVTIDNNANKTPFVIYNSEITPQVIEDYTSYINVLPTIANLFNLDYDPRLMLGDDIFSPNYESLTVFADGSWKNEIAYYNAQKNTVKYYQDDIYDDEDIKRITNDVQTKISVSNKAIKANYFYDLSEKIIKKRKEIDMSISMG